MNVGVRERASDRERKKTHISSPPRHVMLPHHRTSAEMARRSTPYTQDNEILKQLLVMDPLDPEDPPPPAPIFSPVPLEPELFDLIRMVNPPFYAF